MAGRRASLTIPLQGGLGNQLFELAAGLVLAARHGGEVRFTDYWLDHPIPDETKRDLAIDGLLQPGELVNGPAPRVGGLTDRLLARRVVERSADDDALSRVRRGTRTVAGYFQRLDYVVEAWPALRARFAASPHATQRALGDPAGGDGGALHYRLGDYLTNPTARGVHGVTSPAYFADEIRRGADERGISRWRVVSDDPNAALELLGREALPAAVELLPAGGTNEWDDLRTLATARVCLLSNSSFSWWAGFLGATSHGMTVIAPRPWFTDPAVPEPDFFPRDWVRRSRAVLETPSV